MESLFWFALAFNFCFIIVHLGSKYLGLSNTHPRSPLLSFAGGITVAYVFLYLLPELNKYLQPIKQAVSGTWLQYFEDYTYFLALIGLLIYYGLDIVMKDKKAKSSTHENRSFSGVFLLHITSFFLYNMIIGYLLVREEFRSLWGMGLYFLALAFHFIATDHSLREIHEKDYDKYGRWFLAGAIFIGWLVGTLLSVHEVIVGIAVSLLAGGILYNVFKDELPDSNKRNYSIFAGGVMVISILLFLVEG